MFQMISSQPGDRLALIEDGGGSRTYGQLAEGAARLGRAIEKGSLVFCLCSNTIGSVEGYLACSAAGAVPLLVDGRLDESLLPELVSHYTPRFLWVPTHRQAEFPGCCVRDGADGYLLLETGAEPCCLHSELALLLTTSGSTGSPKLVRQSRGNILSNARAIVQYLELTEGERPITTLPMHYTYGLSILHSHFAAGAAVLLTEQSVIRQAFWDFFAAEHATSLAGVPATYDLLKRAGLFERELPSLKTMTQAGGRLSIEMHARCARFASETGRRFFAMYGQTEATARMSYLPWQRAQDKCGSIGIAIPGGRFSLLGADGREITAAGESGELIYEGENVTLGYAECQADLALGDERRGRLATGDLARRDEEGYYYITGRMKRFLKLAGSRINLDECEQLVRTLCPRADCACCGTDDHLRVFVTEAEATEQLRRLLAARLGVRLTSLTVETIAAIPRNSAGKVLYPKLEEV